jgi:nicotinamidase-related amidase
VLDPRTAAVLSIDFQNEYRASGAYPVEGYDAVLSRAAAVIAAARAARIPIVHVQAWVEEEEKADYALLQENVTDALSYGVAGSEGAAICREVAPRFGETVIRKNWPSAFRGTNLSDALSGMGVQHLLTVGVWTDSCVRASVFDAVFAGYRVWLVKDACGSGTETMHRAAVLDMANRLYGGGVLRSGEAIKAIAGKEHAAWRCTRPVEFHYRAGTIDPLYEAL